MAEASPSKPQSILTEIQRLIHRGQSDEEITAVVRRFASPVDLVAGIRLMMTGGMIAQAPEASREMPPSQSPRGIATASRHSTPIHPIPPPAASGFIASKQQEDVFSHFAGNDHCGAIRAVAGSGKTTTLVEGTRRMVSSGRGGRMCYLAFNRSIANTLKKRLPPSVNASTIHSLCYQSLQRAGDKRPLQANRVTDAAWQAVKSSGLIRHSHTAKAAKELRGLWSLALATQTRMNTIGDLETMARNYGSDVEPGSPVFHLVSDVDRRLRDDRSAISYDEMLSEVVRNDIQLPEMDTIFVDEAQDLNRLQMEIFALMGAKRLIAVGDPRQAIYAFRGADAAAMDRLSAMVGITHQFPLTTSYRCSKAIASVARKYVPDFEARSTAPDGEVISMPSSKLWTTIESATPGNLLVCRYNAPLVKAAIRLRSKNIAAGMVGGSDAANNLLAAIDRASRSTGRADALSISLHVRSEGDEKAEKLEGSNMFGSAELIRDEVDTICSILESVNTLDEAKASIQSLFQESYREDMVCFSSIHRAKGLEADKVVFMGPNLLPSNRVRQSGNKTLLFQEDNLSYVAITRAKTTLILQEMDSSS